MKLIPCKLHDYLVEWLDKRADLQGCSRSDLMRFAILDYKKNVEKEEEKR